MTKSDNAMSRNFHYLFEKYFEESRPEHKFLDKVIYGLKKLGMPTLVSALISFLLVSGFQYITDKTNFPDNDFILSMTVALAIFLVTNRYYKIMRKFFVM